MLLLLSPAKTLDYLSPVDAEVAALATLPMFSVQAARLVEALRSYAAEDLAELMDISDNLATAVRAYFNTWRLDPLQGCIKPAVMAFNGDVYEGLDARTLTPEQLTWLQSHVVLLSGLYGALRPLDWLQPYRLEMGTQLRTDAGRNLYDFWGDTVSQHLNDRLQEDHTPVIVNLASQEYSRVALRPTLNARVLHCVFEDWKDDRFKVISFYAKRARGLMTRWAVEHAVTQPQELVLFTSEGYRYSPEASSPDTFVFRRKPG